MKLASRRLTTKSTKSTILQFHLIATLPYLFYQNLWYWSKTFRTIINRTMKMTSGILLTWELPRSGSQKARKNMTTVETSRISSTTVHFVEVLWIYSSLVPIQPLTLCFGLWCTWLSILICKRRYRHFKFITDCVLIDCLFIYLFHLFCEDCFVRVSMSWSHVLWLYTLSSRRIVI